MADSTGDGTCKTTLTERVIQMVINGLVALAIPYLAYLGLHNKDRLAEVQVKQDQAVESAKTVKDTLDTTTVATAKKNAAEAPATVVSLYMTWKYLDGLAFESRDPKDKEAADAARKVYDDFAKKNPKSKLP